MSKRKKSNDLEFVTTEAMLAEIFSRCDNVVFASADDVDGKSGAVLRKFQGNLYMCVGLAEDVKAMVQQRIRDIEESTDNDDYGLSGDDNEDDDE